jgi:DNA end-binding protein Ku
MARSMWRGAIQFGLVTIPIKLYVATESRGGLSFHLLHRECGQRIQMRIHCPEHGEIPRSETVRGFEYAKGQYVIIGDEDFDNVPLKTVRSVEIAMFVDASRDSHGANFVKQAYYIEPEAIGRKAFYLLKTVLAEEGLSAICKIVLKDREALAALNPYSKTMLLTTLYWPDEVRSLEELDLPEETSDFKPAEIAMAKQLVAAMRGDFSADDYKDDYRQALMAVIEAKIAGQPAEVPVKAAPATKITDLMSVLEASLEQAKAAKGSAASAASAAEEPASIAGGRRRRKAEPEKAAVAASSATEEVQPARRRKTA